MSAPDGFLTEEQMEALARAGAAAAQSMNQTIAALCAVTKAHPTLPVEAEIAASLAHLAGQLLARAEMVAFNAGGCRKHVRELCLGSLKDGKREAYAQQEAMRAARAAPQGPRAPSSETIQ